MRTSKKKLAIIFDFDDTLTDDAITGFLLQHLQISDVVAFWKETDALVEQGWDYTLAYMKRLIDLNQTGKIPPITRDALRSFGKTIGESKKFYPGIPDLFDELRKYLDADPFLGQAKLEIEYYVISGGLLDIIGGSPTTSNPTGPEQYERLRRHCSATSWVIRISGGRAT